MTLEDWREEKIDRLNEIINDFEVECYEYDEHTLTADEESELNGIFQEVVQKIEEARELVRLNDDWVKTF
jgi:hypothetical protein